MLSCTNRKSCNATGNRWPKYCFMALLWIPLLLIAVTRDPAFPVPRSVGDLIFFPGEFKHFFNNHFPLRDSMTRLHSRALLALNGPSEIGTVVVGTEGWLFLRMKGDMSIDPAPYDEQIALRTQYEQRAAFCRELGIELPGADRSIQRKHLFGISARAFQKICCSRIDDVSSRAVLENKEHKNSDHRSAGPLSCGKEELRSIFQNGHPLERVRCFHCLRRIAPLPDTATGRFFALEVFD